MDSIIVTTHQNTDLDGLASLIAGSMIYPSAVPVLPRLINPNVKMFTSIHKEILNIRTPRDIIIDNVNTLIVTDTNQWRRIDDLKRLKGKSGLEIIVWDHHMVPGDIQASRTFQEPVGATISLMMRRIKDQNIPMTPILATLFLAGIYEDTGNLIFPSTTAADAFAAGHLLEAGADLTIVNTLVRPAYGEKQKDILFEMLKTDLRQRINGYAVSICKLSLKKNVQNLALVVHMYRDVLNLDAAFGIFHFTDSDRCMVIARSIADGLDVGAIMRSLGGGGHPGAGSAQLKSANPDVLERMIIDLIEGNQQASVQISDLMSFPVFTVPSDMPMKEVGKTLRQKGCTGLPVADDGQIKGMISRRDFKRIKKESGACAPVKAFMIRNVVTIEPGKSPLHAARLMIKHDIGRLPVVDQDGQIIGIVTRSDCMRYFYNLTPD